MRLQQYLNEKFYDAFKQWGHDIEIFVNPDSKEFKELKDSNRLGNIRFFANMKEKKIYMWNGERAIHSDVIRNGLRPTSGFKYDDYVFKGRHADIIFGGHLEGDKVRSDSWDASHTKQFAYPDLAKDADIKTLESIRIMSKQDFNWLNKWMKGSEVKRIVDSLLDLLEEEHGDGTLG